MTACLQRFSVAALRCGGIIERIGHIRGYAAFAGLVAAASAAMALMAGSLAWLVLRAIMVCDGGHGVRRSITGGKDY
jgi:hypothetical protein